MARGRKPTETLTASLQKAIKADGADAAGLAREAGIDRSVISRFVAGRRTITLETADRICAVLRLRLVAGR